jgi:branched-chain amino acid transport system substrate-binding protein
VILQLVGGTYQTVWPERYKQNKDLPQLPFAWKR